MKRRTLSTPLSLVLFLGLLAACGGGEGGDMTTATAGGELITAPDTTEGDEMTGDTFRGIFLNIDGSTVSLPFFRSLLEKGTVTEEDLYPYIDQYLDTQITDIALNVRGQLSGARSDVWTDMVERYLTREINGQEVYFEYLKPYYEICETQGLDPIGVWLRRIREKGQRAWMSIRMNDCHDPDDPYSWVHGAAYYESMAKGWMIGPAYGYYRSCFNYAVDEVRQRELRYLKEQLLRYDVDGVELDFSREWYCFDYRDGKDHAAIMTQFMRDVNDVIEEAETAWGHDIKVNIRLMRDIEQNKAFGFDAKTLVDEKLVDCITVCPRWATCDSDMPIEQWKAAFPDTPIYAGVTDLILNRQANAQAIAGYADDYLNRGADKLYLYNFMVNPTTGNTMYEKIFTSCGDLSTLLSTPKRYVVTYQDIASLGATAWKPLPVAADGATLTLKTGRIAEEEEDLWLIVGVNEKLKKGDLIIRINGVEVSFKSMTRFSAAYAGDCEQYRYTVPRSCLRDGVQTITMETANRSLVLSYLELTVGIHIG